MKKHCQKGIALVVGLIFLVTLAIISVAAMQRTQLEERMTGNTSDANMAFQAAEAALRAGEDYLRTTSALPLFDGTNGLYQPPAVTDPPRWRSVDWSASTASVAYSGMSGAPGSAARASARFFLEELPYVASSGESLAVDAPTEGRGFYRVTARGVGAAGNATVLVESTYRK